MERIAIIGIGRIGLCLALNLERAGFAVLGVDKDRERVALINQRELKTPEAGVEEALRAARIFRVVGSADAIRDFDPDLIFIAVDTPTAEVGGYDHTQIDRVLRDLSALHLQRHRVDLALLCTTMPGYCDSKAEFANEHGFVLSYTPGFVAQGTILRDQQFPDLLLIGEADPLAGERLEQVFRRMCCNHPAVHRMSRLSAEIAKLALNCALTMKITFANAIGDLASSVGAQPERILDAIGADTRIGNKFLKYGFGFGGPCFPRDNRALNFFAKQQNYELLQTMATDLMNQRHLEFQVKQYIQAYDEDDAIHLYSVSYKPGTDILDDSQPIALALQLAKAGRKIVIHDSPSVLAQLQSRYGRLFEYALADGNDPETNNVTLTRKAS